MSRLLPLLLLPGCTLWAINEPCDSAPPVSQAGDPLWASDTTTWQKPAIGDGFVCGVERSDGDTSFVAPSNSLACVGPAASTVLPSARDLESLENIERLMGGGEMLCAMAQDSQDEDVIDFGCWGTGADGAIAGLGAVLSPATHLPSNVNDLAPAQGYLCARITLRQGVSGQADPTQNERIGVFCKGSGSVVEQSNEIIDYRFDEVQTSANMACGRADSEYVGGNVQPITPPRFVCWGDGAAALDATSLATDQSACWGGFDITDGVLCATGPPADDPDCTGVPPVACWGPDDHPIVAGLKTAGAVLDAPSPPVRLSLGPDFGCAQYEPEQRDSNNSVVCWGAAQSAAEATPSGAAWQDLATAPEAGHACALDLAELEPDNSAEPGAPTGRLTCWGDDQEGTLALE